MKKIIAIILIGFLGSCTRGIDECFIVHKVETISWSSKYRYKVSLMGEGILYTNDLYQAGDTLVPKRN